MEQHRKNRRGKVLEFVEEYIAAWGYAPSYDDIRRGLGLSGRSHVNYYLDALERDGHIERTPRIPRSLRLTGSQRATFPIPVAGSIAAGAPLELADRPDEQIEVTTDMADPNRDLFALKVKGNSMVDDLVADGDIVIVERIQEASRGQMAVVHLRDRNAATLKRIYPEGERVRLQPAHPTMKAFYASAADVEVQGRVVAIIRRL
ncbi:MAG: repressor LexA [Anaerolineae bacterium]|nr:repressor LexA [Anaerolineae bacterium]